MLQWTEASHGDGYFEEMLEGKEIAEIAWVPTNTQIAFI